MSGGIKQLKKGDILFREGDPSDAMFVIKKGRIGILKTKGASEITLAELVPGEMLGEMAFFDNKPRSASARAFVDSEVIALPFASLHAQFKTFPEWLRAMVKTVNSHLRNANQTIKNLQAAGGEEKEMFPPYTITRLCAILSLVGYKCGEKTPEGLLLPTTTLRTYTIQFFQQPTNKMDKMMEILSALSYMKVEELTEGRRKIVITNHEMITGFADWYNEYLFKEESKRTTVDEREVPILKGLVHYGRKVLKDEKGRVIVNLTELQNSSMKDLGRVQDVGSVDSLIEKKLIEEKQTGEGNVTVGFMIADLERILPYWELVYVLNKIPAR